MQLLLLSFIGYQHRCGSKSAPLASDRVSLASSFPRIVVNLTCVACAPRLGALRSLTCDCSSLVLDQAILLETAAAAAIVAAVVVAATVGV